MKLTDESEAKETFNRLRDYVTVDEENELYDEDALAALRDDQCPM